jgi:riboflavin kinase
MGLKLKGKIVGGNKTGASFVRKYEDKLKDACGFSPFPGTLNLDVGEDARLPSKSYFISSWTERGTGYGAVWCYPCILRNLQCAVVVPEKTVHASRVVEVISPYCLKSRLGLKTGDVVELEVMPAEK